MQPEETNSPKPLPILSTDETRYLRQDYPSIEHLEAGNVGPWLVERKMQLRFRAKGERTGMNLAKLICLAGGAVGAVCYATNPLAIVGGLVAGVGYVWALAQDVSDTGQFAPIPFVRGDFVQFLSCLGDRDAREEYFSGGDELTDLMFHLPPFERYELGMLLDHTHTLSSYLSQIQPGKRFYAYCWLLDWFIRLQGRFPEQTDLANHLNDIGADPRVDYQAVSALQEYQKSLEGQLPAPKVPQLAESTASLGEATNQSLKEWLATPSPTTAESQTEQTIDVTPTQQESAPVTTYYEDPLINQCVNIILDCLKAKRGECSFLEVVECPKFWRILLRKLPNSPVANIATAGEDLFCELGTVLPELKTPPIISTKVKGGRIAVDIAKPKSRWTTIFFRDHITPSARNFEAPLVIPIGIDMDGNLIESDLETILGLLIAGSTGSGKSVFATGLVASLICRYTPESLRLVLSDTKRVEFRAFADIPHLLYPVAETVVETVGVLEKVCAERERREQLFANLRVRNLQQYNEKVSQAERLPRILVFIEETATSALSEEFYYETDESGDKLTKIFYKDKFNERKNEIKRLARAAGIFLLDSTQSPRRDVLPVLYRGQHIAFACFAVSRKEESEIALAGHTTEAVNLLREGDCLYLDNEGLQRVQSLYINPEEVDEIVNKVISVYGTREEYSLNQVKKRLEDALGRPDNGEFRDRVSEEQGFGGSEVQDTPESDCDTYRDYIEIRKLRSAIPPVSKKAIIVERWGYHSTQYNEGNERYLRAIEEHGAQWVLELSREKKANAGTIASTIWCVRRNDGVIFDNVIAKIHEILDSAED